VEADQNRFLAVNEENHMLKDNVLRRTAAMLRAIVVGAVLAAGVMTPVAARAATTPPRFDHVVLVMEENHSYNEIIGSSSAPYINSLASQGALFTNSFAIEHPSQPNYLDIFSGSNQGVTNDTCPHTFSTNNLGNELRTAGFSYSSYSEDLPSDGSTVCTSGNYARKHNPSVNFSDLPASTNLRFADFPASTGYSSLPTVSLVDPNLQNDMHDGTIQTGDTWLKNNMDAYAQWAKTHNSLLIVTWDEDDSTQSNQIPTLFVGANVTPGRYSERINHYSVLRTLEDAYGLGALGGSASATAITDVFSGGTGNTVTVTNPGDQTSTVGTPASLQINASDSAAGQTLTYSATGLPAGLSINAGTGLISGTPTTAGTSTVTVTAKDTTNASGSTSFTWTVNPSGGSCSAPGQKLGNPGFESGNTVWSASSGVIGQNGSGGEPANSGTWDAWLDGYGTTHTDTLSQTVTIPSGCHASLSFYLHIDTAETSTTTDYDKLTVKAGSTTVATFSNRNAASGYQQHTYDVSSLAGQTVTLLFTGAEDSTLQTSFVVDDTALTLS
jgi:phosphatidylinositol-3-phosphatase